MSNIADSTELPPYTQLQSEDSSSSQSGEHQKLEQAPSKQEPQKSEVSQQQSNETTTSTKPDTDSVGDLSINYKVSDCFDCCYDWCCNCSPGCQACCSVCSVCCINFWVGLIGLIGLAMFTMGIVCVILFGINKSWDNGAMATNCTVIDKWIARNPLHYDPRYDGRITISYTSIYNRTYNKNFDIYNAGKEIEVSEGLNKNYPIGKVFECYYQIMNPTDMRIDSSSTRKYLTLTIIGFAIGGSICLLPCVLKLLICCLGCCILCMEDQKHNIRV